MVLEATDTRNVAQAIYSCLFTLLLCMNVCVRPNVPAPNTSRVRFAAIKAYLMVWMVFLPYTILFWAFMQWIKVREVSKQYRARGWTAAHAHLMVMGGFVLYKEGVPYQVLAPEKLRELVDGGQILFPTITHQDLKRMSSNHPLLTGICILQTTWFVVQIIARLASHLPVTPFEISTFILVAMNLLLLVLFWSKPLDVRQHVRVDLLTPDVDRMSLGTNMTNTVQRDYAREKVRLKRLRDFIAPIPSTTPIPTTPVTPAVWHILSKVIWGILSLIGKIGRDIISLHTRVWVCYIEPGALSVPTFHAPPHFAMAPLFAAPIFGLIFAGAHMPLLLFSFPTRLHTLLWKISILSLAGAYAACTLLFMTAAIVSWIEDHFFAPVIDTIILTFAVFFVAFITIALPCTIVARMIMIIEVFVDLKAFPPISGRTLPWTNFIPHLS